jgi:uncharacterized membrane protein YoaK (UPF0700 family)
MPLSREGKERSFRENLILAHTLPGVAGMVNSIAYVQLGFFASHVTGRASGLGINLAKEKFLEASFMFGLIATFLLGAMTASMLIEIAKAKHWPRFALPLFIEALLLSIILFAEATSETPVNELPPDRKIFFALALSVSMGLQNALVARLSGAVVRTTHLTGLCTDLGIELVRVIRWYVETSKDKSLPQQLYHLAEVTKDAQLYRVRLYATIALTFIVGCFVGATLTGLIGVFALVPPIIVVLGLVGYDRLLAVSEEDLEEDFNPTIDIAAAEEAAEEVVEAAEEAAEQRAVQAAPTPAAAPDGDPPPTAEPPKT